jgi:hypothetical protein
MPSIIKKKQNKIKGYVREAASSNRSWALQGPPT